MFYVGVYSAIGISAAIVALICRFAMITGGLRGANRLFTKLLKRVTRGTMRWCVVLDPNAVPYDTNSATQV